MLLAPAIAVPSAAAAQEAACSATAVPCCRLLARSLGVKAVAPSFGVQIWPADLTSASSIDRLLALRPTHLRFALGPNWRRGSALTVAITDTQLDAEVARGLDRSKVAVEIEVLRRLRTATGAMLHLVIWEPPPLPGEAGLRSGAGRRLRRDDVALAARFYVSVLKAIAERGLQVDAVELSNEPDGDWNIRIAPMDYLALVKAVRGEAARRRVKLPKIYGPAASNLAATRRFLKDPTLGRAILDNVDVLSSHGWDNPKKRDRFVELDALMEDLRRLRRKPELAITEYGLAKPVPSDPSDRMNVKVRSSDTVANTPFYGSISARDLLRFYAGGAGTVIQWEYRDEPWGKAAFGLIDQNGRERPIYQMIRDISTRLANDRPRRIVPTNVDDVFVAEAAGGDVLWSANPSDRAMTLVPDGGMSLDKGAGMVPCRAETGVAGVVVPPWSVTSAPIAKP